MTLHSPLPVEECQARLANGIDAANSAFSLFGFAGSKPIVGRLSGTSFRLRGRSYWHNGFTPFFYGRFEAADGGTRIQGDFGLLPSTKIFMTVWFSFLAICALIAFVSTIAGHPSKALDLVILVVVMVVFGVEMVRLCRWLGRGEQQEIIAFLKRTLEATDVT